VHFTVPIKGPSGAVDSYAFFYCKPSYFRAFLPLAIALLLSLLALFCFPMARVKSTTRVSSGEIHPKATDSASQEAAEVLSSMNQGPLDAVASPSREGSGADASDSDADSGSNNSSDDLSESDSDSIKKAEVAVAATAAGMTFDFGSSTIGKDWIWTMEALCIFPRVLPGPLARNRCRSPESMKLKTCSLLGFACHRIWC
jgi:hypothetical protein